MVINIELSRILLRCADIVLAASGLLCASPLMLVIFVIGLFDTGLPMFVQQRVGRGQKPFPLFKFRTMRPDTASAPTHMVAASSITKLGRFLRRSKLDELPQLVNVLLGNMSLVGPRPCLPQQRQLIEERERRGVFAARPGVTGLAQVREVDMSTPIRLAELDKQMIADMSVALYFRLILATVMGRGAGDRVVKP